MSSSQNYFDKHFCAVQGRITSRMNCGVHKHVSVLIDCPYIVMQVMYYHVPVL